MDMLMSFLAQAAAISFLLMAISLFLFVPGFILYSLYEAFFKKRD